MKNNKKRKKFLNFKNVAKSATSICFNNAITQQQPENANRSQSIFFKGEQICPQKIMKRKL